jgi:lactoylglutathione lyase
MIRIGKVFEAHLSVSNLQQSMTFYSEVLGLELAHVIPERGVAFYWLGGKGKSMLGLWAVSGPLRMTLHTAFEVELGDLLKSATELRKAGVTPLDFFGVPTDDPVVLAWMPAASIYFNDPDGNSLEFLAKLNDEPAPELGVVSWSEWSRQHGKTDLLPW